MISISFIPNVFMVTTIFMIILTSVSTKSTLYQMVLKNEDYITYTERQMKSWEKKMKIDDFYNTIHNMDVRRIPEPVKIYDYDEYLSLKNNYCSKEYVTFESFRNEYQIDQFTKGVKKLKTCFDQFLQDTNRFENKEATVSASIKFILNKEPNLGTSEYSDDFVESIQIIKRCFNGAVQNDSSFRGCFNYKYTEDAQSKKYRDTLMNELKSKIQPLNHYTQFVSCTNTFKSQVQNVFSKDKKENIENIENIVPATTTQYNKPFSIFITFVKDGIGFGRKKVEKKEQTGSYLGLQTIVQNVQHDFTLKELFLAQSLVDSNGVDTDDIDYKNMFHAYAQKKEVKKTDFDLTKCKSKYTVMDKDEYTSTKMFYMMFPSKSENESDDKFQEFKQKRKFILNILKSIDRQNQTVYDQLLGFNNTIKKSEFLNMIRRRAFEHEPNYITYAMRIKYMSDYLPLPKNLWKEERNITNNSKIVPFITQEHKEDMFNTFKRSYSRIIPLK